MPKINGPQDQEALTEKMMQLQALQKEQQATEEGQSQHEAPSQQGTANTPGVGEIVLLGVAGAEASPAVVTKVHEDGTLDVNDLGGVYGRQYGLLPQDKQDDDMVLSWTTR